MPGRIADGDYQFIMSETLRRFRTFARFYEEVVIITANFCGWILETSDVQKGRFGDRIGQESLLNRTCRFKFFGLTGIIGL